VRHGAAAFLAGRERFFGFEDFRALKVTKLDGPTFDARADEREGQLEFGVDIALDNLRCACSTASLPTASQSSP